MANQFTRIMRNKNCSRRGRGERVEEERNILRKHCLVAKLVNVLQGNPTVTLVLDRKVCHHVSSVL